ncbi:hypothetical protein EIP86_004331 [Pleurotus ostreatoroseus]|nr:hypothetical protein EIP86_004331 [Pleurotus ostreatoroseus]
MAAETQSAYRYMQRGLSTTSKTAELMTGQVLSETSGLSRVIDGHHKAAGEHLSEIYQATQTLSDQGTREDMPTGMTPRKRAWEFTDQWTLTKTRETILKEWKQNAALSSSSSSSSQSDVSMFEHVPIREEEESEVEVESEVAMTDGEAEEALSQADEHDETIKVAPVPITKPLVVSTSSDSSSSSQPPPPPVRERKRSAATIKSGLPTRGTLTERPTNIVSRVTRRIRR